LLGQYILDERGFPSQGNPIYKLVKDFLFVEMLIFAQGLIFIECGLRLFEEIAFRIALQEDISDIGSIQLARQLLSAP